MSKSKHGSGMGAKASFETAFSPIDSTWGKLLIGGSATFNELLMILLWRFLYRISAHFFRSGPNFGRQKPKFGGAEILPKSYFFRHFYDFISLKQR